MRSLEPGLQHSLSISTDQYVPVNQAVTKTAQLAGEAFRHRHQLRTGEQRLSC